MVGRPKQFLLSYTHILGIVHLRFLCMPAEKRKNFILTEISGISEIPFTRYPSLWYLEAENWILYPNQLVIRTRKPRQANRNR